MESRVCIRNFRLHRRQSEETPAGHSKLVPLSFFDEFYNTGLIERDHDKKPMPNVYRSHFYCLGLKSMASMLFGSCLELEKGKATFSSAWNSSGIRPKLFKARKYGGIINTPRILERYD
uniref:Uncharacterized protein n=1 Tax=Glossina pallidipes TaxID=7398 RepID=A0A1B0A1X6_GLOPL